MQSKNTSIKFKKTFLAIGIILALSLTERTFADSTSDQLLELDQFLQDIDKGKVTSLPSGPVTENSDSKDKIKEEVSNKSTSEQTNQNISNIISETGKKENDKKSSEDKDEMLKALTNQNKEEDATKVVAPNVVQNKIHENDVKAYIKNKEELKAKIETSTNFSENDKNEDLDYIKEKARIIDEERKTREAEIARLAAIKYIIKSTSIPVNSYIFSVSFNNNAFFKVPLDKSIVDFKQYVLTDEQKAEISADSMPKNDYIKGYKNITDKEVSIDGQKSEKYELGVKYVIQVIDFDSVNNRIRIKIDANNNIQIAEVIETQNKLNTLEEKHYKILQNRMTSEIFWLSNVKGSQKAISLGDGQEIVIKLDNISKTNETLEYKIIDPTDGKKEESKQPVNTKTDDQIKQEEMQKEREKAELEKAEKEKQEKEKGFLGKFF